ncbi:MAG: ABC transporter ATP-binding protein [Patescibacteria group bacterium]|jgi:putative ABC transport system ATP-binding protein
MPNKIVSVHNIHKFYESGHVKVHALKGVSFDLHEGDFLIIKGRNGSGKSTLLRQLGLLDKPDSGTIHLLDEEVIQMKEKLRAKMRLTKIGYIFQEYALLSELTALENVMLPAMLLNKKIECEKRAHRLLSKVGMERRIKSLPNQLSGGEKQKVAIARALINDPKVIFADEPTANLDTQAANSVMKILKELNKHDNHTIVMVTHEPEEEVFANRIIHLADGKII